MFGLNYIDEYYDDTRSMTEALPVSVTAPGDTPAINFGLKPIGSVSGTVIDAATSQPIPNLQILATGYDVNQVFGSTYTDVNGDYSLNLASGIYKIRAYPPATGLNYYSEYFDNKYESTDADPVEVIAPGNTPDIDFSLEPSGLPGTISGTVIDSDTSLPIAHIFIIALDCETRQIAGRAYTDGSGSYTISVPAGNYWVGNMSISSSPNYVNEYFDNVCSLVDATAVFVTSLNDTPNINFSLEIGGVISGTVIDAVSLTPVQGMPVSALIYETDQWVESDITDENGNFSIVVYTGTYKIWANGTISRLDNYVDKYYDDTYEMSEALPVAVTAPDILPGIDFVLDRLYETPPGENVQVTDPDIGVTVEFGSVSEGGDTSIVISDEEPAPTAGFEFQGQYYDIVTTATYSDTITVSIGYDDTGMTPEEEDALRLYHWNGSEWEDVTLLPVDTANNLITGEVSSLSWFAIGTPPSVTWLPPLTTQEIYVAQDGSTIPVKFRLTDTDGNPVTDAGVTVTVTRDSDGLVALSGIVVYEPDIPGYKINAQTKDWELGEYTIKLSVNKDAGYGLSLVEKGQAKGKDK